MPTITVSEDVLAQIRSLKQAGEATEESVLRRVLSDVLAERDKRLEDYERAAQDVQSTN